MLRRAVVRSLDQIPPGSPTSTIELGNLIRSHLAKISNEAETESETNRISERLTRATNLKYELDPFRIKGNQYKNRDFVVHIPKGEGHCFVDEISLFIASLHFTLCSGL